MIALAALLLAQTTVHVESPKEVTLYELISENRELLQDVVLDVVTYTKQGTPMCVAPCTVTVPKDSRYFVAAPGLPPSKSFALPEKDEVTLKVKPASMTHRSLAKAAGVVSLLLLGGGIIGFASGVLVDGPPKLPETIVGFTSMALGLATGIVGIVFWYVYGSTRVAVE